MLQEDKSGSMNGIEELGVKKNCQQELLFKVTAEYLIDFDNRDEATTSTIHLTRFGSEISS